jgi:SPP1 family predicted phage head-tail adaptor
MTTHRTPAGRLNRTIQITDPNPVQDAGGQPIPNRTPNVFATQHAEIMSVTGGEKVRGMMMEAEATDLLRIRYTPGIKPTFVILLDDRVLNILSVRDPDGRRFDHYITCKENTS